MEMRLESFLIIGAAFFVTMLTESGQSPVRWRSLVESDAKTPNVSFLQDAVGAITSQTTVLSEVGGKGEDKNKEGAKCKDGGKASLGCAGKSEEPCNDKSCGSRGPCGKHSPLKNGSIRRIKNGLNVRYHCHRGYWLHGTRSNTCAKVNGKYRWRNHAPECRRIRR